MDARDFLKKVLECLDVDKELGGVGSISIVRDWNTGTLQLRNWEEVFVVFDQETLTAMLREGEVKDCRHYLNVNPPVLSEEDLREETETTGGAHS